MKETYPKYTFSVSRHNYNSIHIYLVKANFEAFKKDKGVVFHHDVNHYNIDADQTLTDRAKEVLKNVCDCVMSYNFDDSDSMTDYFCTNFYLTLGVDTYKKPYKVELPKLDCKGKIPKCSNIPKVLLTRQYAKHWAVHTSGSTTASDCKAKWYSEKIHTGTVATNTSGHYPIQVPRPPQSEWICWRKPVSAASSQAIMAGASSSSAIHPKPKPYLKRSARRLLLHIAVYKMNNVSHYMNIKFVMVDIYVPIIINRDESIFLFLELYEIFFLCLVLLLFDH